MDGSIESRVYQNGQSLIDDAYPKGKGGCLSRTKYVKDINSLLKEILDISYRKVIANIIQQRTPELIVPLSGPISIQASEIDSDHDDNSVTATPAPARAPASSSSYRPVTGLKEKVQSIRGKKELMPCWWMHKRWEN
ncbi:disease resistance RPP8-like protein 3-like [Trifolium medium]|uniref:Disease resistance RPP8-like protein 3-like n=1 Tax=Trifolium medium TaxID=97028 RepID=A0A392PRK7_9FABA|nr:disease resistance RPP8-like protein 3-like [Trifolium medium]